MQNKQLHGVCTRKCMQWINVESHAIGQNIHLKPNDS